MESNFQDVIYRFINNYEYFQFRDSYRNCRKNLGDCNYPEFIQRAYKSQNNWIQSEQKVEVYNLIYAMNAAMQGSFEESKQKLLNAMTEATEAAYKRYTSDKAFDNLPVLLLLDMVSVAYAEEEALRILAMYSDQLEEWSGNLPEFAVWGRMAQEALAQETAVFFGRFGSYGDGLKETLEAANQKLGKPAYVTTFIGRILRQAKPETFSPAPSPRNSFQEPLYPQEPEPSYAATEQSERTRTRLEKKKQGSHLLVSLIIGILLVIFGLVAGFMIGELKNAKTLQSRNETIREITESNDRLTEEKEALQEKLAKLLQENEELRRSASQEQEDTEE